MGIYGLCSNRMRISWGGFPQDRAHLCNIQARSVTSPTGVETKTRGQNKKKKLGVGGLMKVWVAKFKGE